MDPQTIIGAALAGGIVIYFLAGIRTVPQQQSWVVEQFGRFQRILEPGFNYIFPFMQRVAYKHSLKEEAIDVRAQTAITKDNVTLTLDGVLYVKIVDPKAASYGVADPYNAIIQLAQTTMRSEIGKMIMDQTFEERDALNAAIVIAINEASASWGIQCMRYEIKDINPPSTVLKAMELQVAAERQKRAEILESEGTRQSAINIAEGNKQKVVLESEAAKLDQINRAQGEAEAILAVAQANAEGIEKVAIAIQKTGGDDAVAMKLGERYIEAFEHLAKTSNTILLPADTGDTASMVAQSLAVFKKIKDAG